MSDKPILWHDCYESGWKGVITPDSFAHPAKFSRSLIERIFQHCLQQGYLSKGQSVGDCFGGIGTGGIMAAYAGLEWIGCELEPRFVNLAESNFALHQAAWTTMKLPWPRIIQGDSRHFDVLMGEDYDAMVSSPPFVQSGVKDHEGQTDALIGKFKGGGAKFLENYDYGQSKGQIGQLKSGSVDGVISSPPYISGGHHPDQTGAWNTNGRGQKGTKEAANYGKTNGQIGNLKGGDIAAIVTSPPYAGIRQDGGGEYAKAGKGGFNSYTDGATDKWHTQRDPKNIGNLGDETNVDRETYWQAMDAVYRACHRAIKPGGVIVLVLKDYVSKGKRVPLCDDTARLLEHIGFTVIERIHAMLVKETRHADMFEGETTHKKERKSFFRRLAEKKGSPPIDFEEVLFARKTL